MNKLKAWWSRQASGLRTFICVLLLFALVGGIVWVRTIARESGYTWRSDGVSMLVWILLCLVLVGGGVWLNNNQKGR